MNLALYSFYVQPKFPLRGTGGFNSTADQLGNLPSSRNPRQGV